MIFRLFSPRRENKASRTEWRQYTWTNTSGWSDGQDRHAGSGYNGQYGQYGQNGQYGRYGQNGQYGQYGQQGQYQSPYSTQPSALSLAYATLGVAPEATDSEVKSAYKRLAVKFHPDKFATATKDVQMKAEEQFKKINEAYQTVKKRRGLD